MVEETPVLTLQESKDKEFGALSGLEESQTQALKPEGLNCPCCGCCSGKKAK